MSKHVTIPEDSVDNRAIQIWTLNLPHVFDESYVSPYVQTENYLNIQCQ